MTKVNYKEITYIETKPTNNILHTFGGMSFSTPCSMSIDTESYFQKITYQPKSQVTCTPYIHTCFVIFPIFPDHRLPQPAFGAETKLAFVQLIGNHCRHTDHKKTRVESGACIAIYSIYTNIVSAFEEMCSGRCRLSGSFRFSLV